MADEPAGHQKRAIRAGPFREWGRGTPTELPPKRDLHARRPGTASHRLPGATTDPPVDPAELARADARTRWLLSRVRRTTVSPGVAEVRVGGRLVSIEKDGDVIARPDFRTMMALRRRGADEMAAIGRFRGRGYTKAQMDLIEWFRSRGGRLATGVSREYAERVRGLTAPELDRLVEDGILARVRPALELDAKRRPITAPAPQSGPVPLDRRGRCGETAATCPLFAERGLAACGPCPFKHERFPISVGGKLAPRA